MKPVYVLTLAVATSLTAFADFSYTSTSKSSGAMGGMGNNTTKHFMKGTKMKTDTGNTATIVDFGAETITLINNGAKTYTVTKFSDMAAMIKDTGAMGDLKVDVRETGQKRDINGFAAREYILTMETSMDAGPGGPTKMKIEMDMWISSAVPGASEMKAFYQRNGSKLHLMAGASGAGGNASMQKAMQEMQKKMYSLDGVQVLQVMKMMSPGMPGMDAGKAAQMKQGMAQMQAQMEQLKKTNPEAAKMMEQRLAGMGAMGGGGGGALIEVTTESTGFSTAAVPDSVFAIPAGYTQKAK